MSEVGDERGVFQDVEQVDGAPPALDPSLEHAEVLRLGELAELRDAHPGCWMNWKSAAEAVRCG